MHGFAYMRIFALTTLFSIHKNRKAMMKKFFICISMLFCLSTFTFAGDGDGIPLNYQPQGSTHGGHGKAPARPWYIDLNDNIITMSATPCDYILNLYDEDDDIVYSAFVPAGTTQIVLPTILFGEFELRFETDSYYYYGFITL